MNGSIKLGNVFGIPVRIHVSFLFMLALFALVSDPLWILVVFFCVFLHELGHGLAARSFGIHVIDITFWPFGGMARMSGMPEIPRVEAIVALAGPLTNLALAALASSLWILSNAAGLASGNVFDRLIVVNLILGLFNLIPAFPMDGGRVLRSWFARRVSWIEATDRAVAVGRWIAGLFCVVSIPLMWVLPSLFCMAPLLAAFIWVMGMQELIAVRMRSGGFAGGEPPAGAHQPPFHESAPEPETGARRPTTWEERPLREMGEDGFGDDMVRDLERFRGRLRRDGSQDG